MLSISKTQTEAKGRDSFTMQNPFAGMAALEADTNKQSQPEDTLQVNASRVSRGVRSSGDKYWAEGEESELNTEYTCTAIVSYLF